MSHDHEPPDWDGEYAKIGKQMGVCIADDRETQVMVALDADESTDFADLLRGVLDEHDGRKNSARRAINKQLEAADHYDDDAHGVVSTSTIYKWCKEYFGDDGNE